MIIFGAILQILGFLLCLTVIGAVIGVPLIILGGILIIIGFVTRRKTVVTNVITVQQVPGADPASPIPQGAATIGAGRGRFGTTQQSDDEPLIDPWKVLIGLGVVVVTGALVLFVFGRHASPSGESRFMSQAVPSEDTAALTPPPQVLPATAPQTVVAAPAPPPPSDAPRLPDAWEPNGHGGWKLTDMSKWPVIVAPKCLQRPVTEPVPDACRSMLIPAPPFGHLYFSGAGFILHTIYQDGTDCVNDGRKRCPDGAIASFYITSADGGMHFGAYAHASADQP